MNDQIRKAIESVAERLQVCADALGRIVDRNRLVAQPVPVRTNDSYSTSYRPYARR